MNSLSRICSIYVQKEGDINIQRAGVMSCVMTLGKRCFILLCLSFHISEIEMMQFRPCEAKLTSVRKSLFPSKQA